MLAGLVERGIDKAPFFVTKGNNRPLDRDAVHVNVEDVHENAEPKPRLRTHAELRRRNGVDDGKQLAIGRTYDQTRPVGRDAIGIAEKGDAPKRERRERKGGPGREPKQREIEREEQSN